MKEKSGENGRMQMYRVDNVGVKGTWPSQSTQKLNCPNPVLKPLTFEDGREEMAAVLATQKTWNGRNSPLSLPNKRNKNNKVKHDKATTTYLRMQ